MSPFSQRFSGFTLIEVLAALVIVALGMLGAITAVNQATRNGTYLREKTLAHWVAMNLLTERRLQASAPDVAETKGEVEFANERWRWSLRVTQTEVRSLRRMDVTVALAASPETSSLATLSGFYGTAISTASGGTVVWAGSGAPGSGGEDEGEDEGDDGNGKGNGVRPNQPAQPDPPLGEPADEPPEPGDEE
ncbi:MAG TPA: type II secretion system minor pseudopilin GspI [Steroidobacteraceae bacterium]|nr:type II secretion system minor pseudopilin GspI [Steroidobacteraceae bacterium]